MNVQLREVALALSVVLSQAVLAGAVQEVEPNNVHEKAMAVPFGTQVVGTVHFHDGLDHYRFAVPREGKLTATVSGQPADVAFQVLAAGFSKYPTLAKGWTDGKPGQPARYTFEAKDGLLGTICVRLLTRRAAVSTDNWGGVWCSANGPWYTTPQENRPPGPAPARHGGRPVAGPIRYVLTLAYGDGSATATTTQSPAQPTRPLRTDLTGPKGQDYIQRAMMFWALVCADRLPDALALTTPDFRASAASLGTEKFTALLLKHGKGSFRPIGCESLDSGTVVVGGRLDNPDGSQVRVTMFFKGTLIDTVNGRYRRLKQ